MPPQNDLRDRLHRLVDQQRPAVPSTHNRGEPYASLVAFAATDDLRQLVFATPRATRKFSNMTADARAAMLKDSRSYRAGDFRRSETQAEPFLCGRGRSCACPWGDRSYTMQANDLTR